MAGTGSARGGLGWVILVVALAVPGVLFYNWWSHLKAEREKSVAAKAHARVPDGGVFQSSPNAKLVNPMTPAVSTDTAAAPVAAVAAAPSASDAQAAVVAAPAPVQAAEPVPGASAAVPAASASTAAVAAPLKRDPTMSPLDAVRIAQEEQAKRQAAEDLANLNAGRQNRGSKKAAKRKSPIDTLELQGIISNPESGFKAIVNNEVVGAGEMIGSTGIKVLKISDLGVTFLYQGKRFSKGVSRD